MLTGHGTITAKFPPEQSATPIDDLTGAIETLQQRTRRRAPALRANETRPRPSLLAPQLPALDWAASHPAR